MNGIELIAAERQHQILRGYDASHDSQHYPSQLKRAAVAVIENDETMWPWPDGWKDRRSYVETLTVAAALLAAAIDCLLASSLPEGPCPTCGGTDMDMSRPEGDGVHYAPCPDCADGRASQPLPSAPEEQ